jgi:hypothetical protein
MPLPTIVYCQTGTDGSFCSNYCLQRYINQNNRNYFRHSVLIDYIVVDGDTSQSLSVKVNQYLKQGWRLQGGISMIEMPAPIGRRSYIYILKQWSSMDKEDQGRDRVVDNNNKFICFLTKQRLLL